MRHIELIDAKKIAAILDKHPNLVKSEVMNALQMHYAKKIKQPPKQYIRRNQQVSIIDRIISMPVYVDGNPGIAGIKWIGSHPDNYSLGMERANALIILNDPKTNAPMAILDASQISTQRTFAMTLIGIDTLYPQVKTVACLGMGKLGRLHAKMLPKLYPGITKIYCFSQNALFDDLLSEQVVKCNSYQEAISAADVVITTTSATRPYITFNDVIKSKLIINQSVMDFHKDVFTKSSHVIVDDWDECFHAKSSFTDVVNEGLLKKEQTLEIGQIIFGKIPINSGLIFFNPLGMAIEDIMVAHSIYRIALANEQSSVFYVE